MKMMITIEKALELVRDAITMAYSHGYTNAFGYPSEEADDNAQELVFQTIRCELLEHLMEEDKGVE